MPIDASIYNQVGKPTVELESPQNALMRQVQLQNAQNQNKLGNMQLQDATDARATRNALASAYQSAIDPNTGSLDYSKLSSSLAAGGQGAQVPGVLKQKSEQDKATRDADKAKLESVKQHIELQGQLLGGVKDQNSWTQALEVAQQNGIDVSKFPPQYDPNMVNQLKQRALSAAQQVEQEWKAKKYDLDVDEFNYKKKNDAANRGVQVRGQNLKYATDTGANAAAVGKKTQDVELKLQDDYRQESKGFGETSTAMKKMLGAIDTADKNPGSALAAGTGFMKILDPNSVVRETELGMALNASGWFDRATNIANTLRNGRVMTAEQKKNLKSAAEDLFEEAKSAQREVDAAYKKRATDYGASPERVIVDRGQNTVRPKPAKPGEVPSDIADLLKKHGGK